MRAAAARLSITQPALSLRLKDLETTLGDKLLDRTSYRATLTTLGQEVAQQAARMLDTKEEAAAHGAKQKISVDYEIGDAVKVLDGPFATFNGTVEELDFDRGRVKVSVSIFGRATPVELEFEQVERVK